MRMPVSENMNRIVVIEQKTVINTDIYMVSILGTGVSLSFAIYTSLIW